MVHRHYSVGFGTVGMQNPDCPALNGDRSGDIAKAAGGLDELLERASVFHRRRREGAAPLADEFCLQRSVRQLDVAGHYVLEELSRVPVGPLVFDMQVLG